jgi:hypothetical protein
MKRLFLFITLLIFLVPGVTYGACGGAYSGSSPGTITSYDCSKDCIQNAINASADGDIVKIKSGTCAVTPAITVTNKAITLRGETDNAADTVLSWDGSGSTALINVTNQLKAPEIAYFTIHQTAAPTGGQEGAAMIYLHKTSGLTTKTYGWKIHNMVFETVATTTWVIVPLYIDGYNYGVIYSNVFQGGVQQSFITERVSSEVTGAPTCAVGEYGSLSWARPVTLGSLDAVVVEDNTYTSPNCSPADGATWDNNSGARMIFRHNDVTNLYMGDHGAGHASNGHGALSREIYDNTFTVNSPCNPVNLGIEFEGGTGVIYNNTRVVTNYGSAIRFAYYRTSCTNPPGGGGVRVCLEGNCNPKEWSYRCDGLRSLDGNIGPYGYPCVDSPGRVGPVGSQTLSPVYIWNNGNNVASVLVWGGTAPNGPELTAADRDFYDSGISTAQTSKGVPFAGTSGVGWGILAYRPDACTTGAETGGGVGYWATDTNTLYRCSVTGNPGTWVTQYTPLIYPHPLRGSGVGIGAGVTVGGGVTFQ